MKLLRLRMKNFMPFRGDTSLTFPTDAYRNVMIVFGENMRGKTSLMNAIRWCLYNVALGRHLVEIPLNHLLNLEAAAAGDWSIEVTLEFEADGHVYEMTRLAKKARLVSTPDRPEHFDQEVHLKRDGAAISGLQIEGEINKFAPQQVSRFFLFDGELLQEYETLLIEGSDQGKLIKEAIEQVLGVPSLINGRTEFGSLLKKARKQWNSELAHFEGIKKYVDQQSRLQSKQEAVESDLAALDEKLRQTKDLRTGLDDEIEATEAIFQNKQDLIVKESRQKDIVEEQSELDKERLSLLADAWRDLIQPKIQTKLAELEAERTKMTNAIRSRGSLDSDIAHLNTLLKLSSCPTCGQDVGDDCKHDAREKLINLEKTLYDTELNQHSFDTLSSRITMLRKLSGSNVVREIKSRESRIAKLDIELTKLDAECEKLRLELRNYDTVEIGRKRARRDNYIKEETKIEREISEVRVQLDGIKKDLEVIARQLRNNPEGRAGRNSVLVQTYSGLEGLFGASIEKLRDSLRSTVEMHATEAFKQLTTQKAYSGLEINNNYGLTILDEHNNPVPIRSAGAEQIVALSLINGLSRTGRSAGPVIMDTPFGRLDLKHRDNILRYMPNAASQFILLVHYGEIRGKPDLGAIASRIGAEYEIREVNPRHSVIERVLQ